MPITWTLTVGESFVQWVTGDDLFTITCCNFTNHTCCFSQARQTASQIHHNNTHTITLNWMRHTCSALGPWLNAERRVMSSNQAQIHLFISIMIAQTNHTGSTHTEARLSPACWREEVLIGTGDRSGASRSATYTHHLTTKTHRHMTINTQLYCSQISTLFLLKSFQKNTNVLLVLVISLYI